MATKKIAVLDPTVKGEVTAVSTAPRIRDLKGKVAGFLWNNKPNGEVVLQRIQEQLSQRFGLTEANWYRKDDVGVLTDASILDELTQKCNLVINGVGD
ncbi:hypothetical protein ACFLTY_04060 [Chloroflexota bacterium]